MMRNTSHKEKSQNWLSLLALVIAIASYLIVGLANLNLPGLQYDEAADAVPAMELLRSLPNSAFSTINLFGLRLPLMLSYYIGPTTIYLSWAGMAVFGTTVAGLRITMLLAGVLTLLLLYFLARAWFDPLTGGISVLLCATAPAFVWWSRAGANFTLPILALAMLLLFFTRRWWQTRNPALLIAAAFMAGLGLTTKLLFYWQLVSLGIFALIVLGLPGLWKTLRNIPTATLIWCTAALALGLAPFIIYNIPSGASFHFLLANTVQSHIYGHNNLDVVNNVRFEADEFVRMMGGDTLHFDAPAGLPFGTFAIIISLLYTAYLSVRHHSQLIFPAGKTSSHTPPGLRLRFLLLLNVLVAIPLGTISVSSIGARHLFIIVPLAWLLVALTIVDALHWFKRHLAQRLAVIASVGLVVILPLNALVTNFTIQSFFVTTGGRGLWSDALNTLAQDLLTRYAGRPVMALDWGFERSIAFLTQEQVHMREMYEYQPEPSPKFNDVATVMLRDPANIYVFHAPWTTAFGGYLEVMQRRAAEMHKDLVLQEVIRERDGAENTLIYTAVDTPRSFVISPTLATRNAIFTEGLTLLGGNAAYDPARHEVALWLYWLNTSEHQTDDTELVHIIDQSNGNAVLIADQQPFDGTYPFSQWKKGEVVLERRWIELPPNLKPGVYQVRVGVYNTKTGERRAIDDPQHDAAGNSLMLRWFQVK